MNICYEYKVRLLIKFASCQWELILDLLIGKGMVCRGQKTNRSIMKLEILDLVPPHRGFCSCYSIKVIQFAFVDVNDENEIKFL